MVQNFFYICTNNNNMATTKFFLDMRGKSKDGKGSVLIRLYHNRASDTFPTGVRVSPSCWSGDSVIHVPGCEVINASLQNKKSEIDRAIAMLSLEDSFDVMTPSEIKRVVLSGRHDKKQRHTLENLFHEYMDNGQLKEGTKAIYKSTLNRIVAFCGNKVTIEELNLKWLRSFDSFLSRQQGINGKAIYLRSLRAVCNYARHNSISCPYPFDNFHIRQEETRKRSITVEQMREFLNYPTTPANNRYRDYFLLMFYLIGINTKDILLARKDQIVDGRLEYTREKTGKHYSIKIEPEAQALIDKYSGKNYLLEAMDHCKLYRSFAREINDALKLIGDTVEEEIPDSDNLFAQPKIVISVNPVIPGLTTYYARHTWATLAYEIGLPMDTISQAMGHSFGNRTTLIYVKFDQQKVDEANRKVIDYLLDKTTQDVSR